MQLFAFVCFVLAFVIGGFGLGYLWAWYSINKKIQKSEIKLKNLWKPNKEEPWQQDPNWWKH